MTNDATPSDFNEWWDESVLSSYGHAGRDDAQLAWRAAEAAGIRERDALRDIIKRHGAHWREVVQNANETQDTLRAALAAALAAALRPDDETGGEE